MSDRRPRPGVVVSRRVIEPTALSEHISSITSAIRRTTPNLGAGTGPEAEHLIRLAAEIDDRPSRAIQTHPGLRGRVSGLLKGSIRRLIYWYVDPAMEAQAHKNTLISGRLVTDAQEISSIRSELEELRVVLAHTERQQADLQRQVLRLRRQSGTDQPPGSEGDSVIARTIDDR